MCFGDLFWGGRFGRLGWTATPAATAMAMAELQNRLSRRILERNAVWWPFVFVLRRFGRLGWPADPKLSKYRCVP